MPGHLSCTSDIEQHVAHVLLSSPVQKKSVVQNGANFILRIISGKVYGLRFFGKRTNQRLESGSDFNRNVDKKA
jgi:hypothetical protein